VQQPFVGVPLDSPNPAVAAALGIIPGVGAMYNGQFLKGLIHVFIFAVLVSTTGHRHIFGLFIPAWILYQVFEAYHVAKARRDGQPVPDPLGLNEIGNWLNLSGRPSHPGQPGAAPGANPGGVYPNQGAPPYTGTPYGTEPGASSYQQPPWQPPYQGPAGAGYPNPYANPGVPPVPPVPQVPPMPPLYWKRREPIGAVILIALGAMFLLGQLDLFSGHVFEFAWPLMLIGLGAWLIVRRMQDPQGGPR
jgi:TM2 domain-containing membrane protein YozV